jgi:anti-sigma regulatory factor (Ser/Thr protein kinase)
MPNLDVPTNSNLHAAKDFLSHIDFFENADAEEVEIDLHPTWMHIDPFGLVALAAWADWQQRLGRRVLVRNLGKNADYVWRMRLFDFVDTNYQPQRVEHEEAGRFMPLRKISNSNDIRDVVADISALLHLEDNPDSLAAVQYCVSELLRNVIEHSGSAGGALICAQNYIDANPRRVAIAVADCGVGISEHLGRVHGEALENDAVALNLAMQPGVTGAQPGLYGTPDNAGAGLFITRSIAKGTGGYYLLTSGSASYRLRRATDQDAQAVLFVEPLEDRHDTWENPHKWFGTIVSMEVRTDQIESFEDYFSWIRKYVPTRAGRAKKIQFT